MNVKEFSDVNSNIEYSGTEYSKNKAMNSSIQECAIQNGAQVQIESAM
jgi:hypothetical protein